MAENSYRQAAEAIGGYLRLVGTEFSRLSRMPVYDLVIASFDESGKFMDSEVVAFGGCIAKEQYSRRFTDAWHDILQSADVPFMSMKDAMSFSWPFDKFRTRRDDLSNLLRSLGRLVQCQDRICAPITSSEFRSFDVDKRNRFRNPQYFGFEACAKVAMDRLPEECLL